MSSTVFQAGAERIPGGVHILLIATGSVASIKVPLIVADLLKDGYKIGDPILHIELRRWADVVLIAPCSANTLAKMAGGLCDNLATSVLRALAPTTPTYVFPAMNTLMYEHPLTTEHLRIVRDVLHYEVVGPIGKNLACGDIGLGAMTEWKDIVNIVVRRFMLIEK
ncbi:flavo protein [Sanghuangporus baumii]|uniref:Flavo protein n=1 Tax=Sanghuangporus baumii TaxID=108892 RepID=A0A9Q5NBQ5_SANBA|nr:flavo protein [Sanghuangporus baumii]